VWQPKFQQNSKTCRVPLACSFSPPRVLGFFFFFFFLFKYITVKIDPNDARHEGSKEHRTINDYPHPTTEMNENPRSLKASLTHSLTQSINQPTNRPTNQAIGQ
jgi:hypothetical protein